MCECRDGVGGILEPDFDSGVAKGHEFGGNHQNLLNTPRSDEIMYQSFQKVYPTRAEHSVRKDGFLLGECH